MFKDNIDPLTKYPKPPVECFHGGQSYRYCPDFKCDFSVTTNISGPPKDAIEAAKEVFVDIEHYPEQDAWVPRCHLAENIGFQPNQIRLGNGASELIDLISRIFEPGTTWRPHPNAVQYLEFDRAFRNAGLSKLDSTNIDAQITVIVNPNSPTGDYIDIEEMRSLVLEAKNSIFVIDESFIMCYGPDWLNHSSLQLIKDFPDRIIVLTSWTKVWACPSLRLGTVISSQSIIDRIDTIQPPWTVNGFAQAFFIKAINDKNYFNFMWEFTPKWNQLIRDKFIEIGCKPNLNAPLWVPYVYCDMLNEEAAKRAHQIAFDNGLPIRKCDDFEKYSFVRIGVRDPKYIEMLFDVFKSDEILMNLLK